VFAWRAVRSAPRLRPVTARDGLAVAVVAAALIVLGAALAAMNQQVQDLAAAGEWGVGWRDSGLTAAGGALYLAGLGVALCARLGLGRAATPPAALPAPTRGDAPADGDTDGPAGPAGGTGRLPRGYRVPGIRDGFRVLSRLPGGARLAPAARSGTRRAIEAGPTAARDWVLVGLVAVLAVTAAGSTTANQRYLETTATDPASVLVNQVALSVAEFQDTPAGDLSRCTLRTSFLRMYPKLAYHRRFDESLELAAQELYGVPYCTGAMP
jgi:hypothetical protein